LRCSLQLNLKVSVWQLLGFRPVGREAVLNTMQCLQQ
jgi:hypothetical protein